MTTEATAPVCEFCGAPAVAIIEHEYEEIVGVVRATVCADYLAEYNAAWKGAAS